MTAKVHDARSTSRCTRSTNNKTASTSGGSLETLQILCRIELALNHRASPVGWWPFRALLMLTYKLHPGKSNCKHYLYRRTIYQSLFLEEDTTDRLPG